tara:strand:- start:1106 stop:1666 length:561 start_codon:yes stop_codon:yes gene_type:complete
MDIFTHFIIGASIGEIAPKDIKNRHAIGAGFALLPDVTNLLLVHPYLGWLAGRTIPFAYAEDFITHPEILSHWTYHVWLFTHGLIFWSFFVLPFWRKHRSAPLAILAYLSHILMDMPSHSGIYGTQPFYPFPLIFDGWFDAWLWGPLEIFGSAIFCACIFLIVRQARKYWKWESEVSDRLLHTQEI